MAEFSTYVGTVKQSYTIGDVALVDAGGGILEFRTADLSSLIIIRGASPTGNDDFATRQWVLDQITSAVSNDAIEMRAQGYLRVVSNLDTTVITKPRTIAGVRLFREVSGTSGETEVDIKKNGNSIFSTTSLRPDFDNGVDNQSVLVIPDQNLSLVAGDRLNFDITAVEIGRPQNISLSIYFA